MKTEIKKKAIRLRRQGYSLNEISDLLDVAKSTVSLWSQDVELSRRGRKRLEWRCQQGSAKGALSSYSQSKFRVEQIQSRVNKEFQRFTLSKKHKKLICALLYWCEGGKQTNYISFINSDPVMMGVFVKLLRSSFDLDESKFRLLIHLHDYHDEVKQKKFWSEVTDIDLRQFTKSYIKPHTGKNKHEGYPGCVALKYYDYKIAKELTHIYELIGNKYGRVV